MRVSLSIGSPRMSATLRTTTGFTALDRYSAIRKFFRQEAAASVKARVLPLTRTNGYSKTSIHRTYCFTSARSTFNPKLSLHFHPSASLARAYATESGTQKPPQENGKVSTPPQGAKADPPVENIVDAENNFPHARDHENYSQFFRKLAEAVPHPHRPTREDLLNVATTFWQRLRIRFKWFTVRSFRKFNADDISAFVSWFLVSQTLWILIGTCVLLLKFYGFLLKKSKSFRTTFFSVLFATLNSLRLQSETRRLFPDFQFKLLTIVYRLRRSSNQRLFDCGNWYHYHLRVRNCAKMEGFSTVVQACLRFSASL